jgi:hypothetical protein
MRARVAAIPAESRHDFDMTSNSGLGSLNGLIDGSVDDLVDGRRNLDLLGSILSQVG